MDILIRESGQSLGGPFDVFEIKAATYSLWLVDIFNPMHHVVASRSQPTIKTDIQAFQAIKTDTIENQKKLLLTNLLACLD